MDTKFCKYCNCTLDIENFPERSRARCRACSNGQKRLLNALHKENPLPPGTVCEICRRPGKLCLDHCHVTNEFRGWLCRYCNLTIAYVGDSRELLMRAAAYVHRHAPPLPRTPLAGAGAARVPAAPSLPEPTPRCAAPCAQARAAPSPPARSPCAAGSAPCTADTAGVSTAPAPARTGCGTSSPVSSTPA